MGKTPKFDAALDTILKGLAPHERTCAQCSKSFQIFKEDIEGYKKFRVPPPKSCPDCRKRRRLAFANYTTFFKRPCNVPEHREAIISDIPEGAPFLVYDFDYYWSDVFHADGFTVALDAYKPFFTQFSDLFRKIPQPASTRDPASVGSDYTLYGIGLKNCYYTFGGISSEEVDYSVWGLYSKHSMDMLLSLYTELGYEEVFPMKNYNCNFTYFSSDCLDSALLYDCRNCSNCFGCVNLRNKQYYFFNEPLTAEEYKVRMAGLRLGDRNVLKENHERFWKLVKSLPVRASRNQHSENVIGNYIDHSRNCFNVFWAMQAENLRHTDFVIGLRDSTDVTISSKSERLYETVVVSMESFNTKFSVNCRVASDSEYLINCRECSYCFGCVGLKSKKFCIFNEQYTEDEYWKKLDSLKTEMLARGEYGEFFPMNFSMFPYNASFASLLFPSSQEDVERMGGWWHDPDVPAVREETVTADMIPESINDVPDTITEKVIEGIVSKRPFKIRPADLAFYRRKNTPLPLEHPRDRIMRRFSYANYFRMSEAACAKCGRKIQAGYNPSEGYIVYCESCYQSEVV
jgi:CxxC-x17-CxxC domain-containing protein